MAKSYTDSRLTIGGSQCEPATSKSVVVVVVALKVGGTELNERTNFSPIPEIRCPRVKHCPAFLFFSLLLLFVVLLLLLPLLLHIHSLCSRAFFFSILLCFVKFFFPFIFQLSQILERPLSFAFANGMHFC